MERIKDYSFGIILINRNSGEDKFLLLRSANTDEWLFPKGHKEGDETSEETVRRELDEETQIKTFDFVKSLEYQDNYEYERGGIGYDKTVIFFVGITQEEEVIIQEKEIGNFKWVNYEDALRALSFEEPRIILRKAVEDLIDLNLSKTWIPDQVGNDKG